MEYIANNFGLELPSFATTRRHYIMKVQTRSLAMMMDWELERLWMLQEEEEELTTTHARATTTTTTCLDIPPISSLVLEDIPCLHKCIGTRKQWTLVTKTTPMMIRH